MKNLLSIIDQNFNHDEIYFELFALRAEVQTFSQVSVCVCVEREREGERVKVGRF
jgi:hypothetical protein